VAYELVQVHQHPHRLRRSAADDSEGY